MRAALSLARRGLGRVAPNPAVGCVIVAGGRLVGRGWTQPGGRPHAEASALAQAGSAAAGATAYVTLEPCAHYGLTPPCAKTLVEAGIARVVSTIEDPDPRVAGKGFAILREAGVDVVTGVLADEAETVNEGFLKRQRRGLPFVSLKLASTMDGRIATSSGESQWITGPRSRAFVHLMRAEADAILVGAGTARADDPSLDVRLAGLETRSPIRVVIDTRLELPPDCRLAASGGAPVIRAHHEAVSAPGAWGELLPCPAGPDGRLDLEALLRRLADRGVTRLFSEGGGAMAAGLLKAALVDEIVWATAGKVIGGDGWPAVDALGLGALADAPGFVLQRERRIGEDLFSYWRPAGAGL